MSLTSLSNHEFNLDIRQAGDTFHVLAPHLAKSLGFREAFDLLRSIPDAEKGSELVRTPGGEQRVGYVTEAGFYRALGQRQASRIADEALRAQVERFQSWVYAEVLPSIRRHGGYLTPEATEAALTDPDFIIHMATTIKEERARRALAEERAAELAAPAAAWDVMVAASGDYAVADAAKMLSRDPAIEIGRDRLFTWMSDAGWIYRHQGRRPGWRARQSQVDCGRLVEKANAAFQNRTTGEMESALPTIRITPKGLGELHKRLGGIEPLSPVAAVA